jgi:hypothetical protein
MNWKGFGRKQLLPDWGTFSTFAWRDGGNYENPRITVAPAEIRTEHLSIESLERHSSLVSRWVGKDLKGTGGYKYKSRDSAGGTEEYY